MQTHASVLSHRWEPAPTVRDLASLLVTTAAHHPNAMILHEADATNVLALQTYATLLDEAHRVLAGLVALSLKPGHKVALLLERSRDFVPAFWACILGGFVPCPIAAPSTVPGRWTAQQQRLKVLLEEPLFVTTAELKNTLSWDSDARVALASDLAAAAPETQIHRASPEDLAMLVLTSGSTGNPKAVMLSHANLLASMASKAERHELTARDTTLNWVSFDHVAALLECHLLPLYVGAMQIHVPARTIIAEPLRFIELIAEHRVTMTFTPNFLLGQVVRDLATARGRLVLDLSSVRQIICGGEAVVVPTARAFLDALAPYGLNERVLWPAFGMTETCAGSVYSREFPAADAGCDFASLGLPVRSLEMRIVDEELQVRGPMIFAGYYNDANATSEAFTTDGWFRTGDRGEITQGRLQLTGRSKDSIIVNGVNYYSHDLEAALAPIAGLEMSYTAAFPTRAPGRDTEELVVVFTCARSEGDEASMHRLVTSIRNTVLLHWGFRPSLILWLPAHEIPKTSLGKIQRSLLRKRLEASDFARYQQAMADLAQSQLGDYIAPQGPIETALAEIFGTIVATDPRAISATTSFFDLGGTSIEILQLMVKVKERFGTHNLSLSAFFQAPTVRDLARSLTTGFGSELPAYDLLVALQTAGRGTPLFCIHPGVGEVLVFVGLAQALAQERPVYALRARGFNAGEAHFQSFGEMVAIYAAAIRRAQPRGPYALMGYSYGGVVAFEVAKELERGGERVAFVGVVNVPPHINASRKSIDFPYTAANLATMLGLISPEAMAEMLPSLRMATSVEELAGSLIGRASSQRLVALDLDLAKFSRWAEVAYSLVRIGRDFEPTGSVEALSIFYADPPPRYVDLARRDWLVERLEAWKDFSRTAPRYLELDAAHQKIMGDHLGDFQAALRQELDRTLDQEEPLGGRP